VFKIYLATRNSNKVENADYELLAISWAFAHFNLNNSENLNMRKYVLRVKYIYCSRQYLVEVYLTLILIFYLRLRFL
jgi:hypothetical protein